MKVFLLCGQSNMAGRGEFGQFPPIRDPRCFMLRCGQWVPMEEPVTCDKCLSMLGIGPGSSFAKAYAETFDEDVGLVACAYGGSSLTDWRVDGPLFRHAVAMGKLVQETDEIAGILWHQGESENFDLQRAETYAQRFTKIMESLLARLHISVPVILGELGSFQDTEPYNGLVNEQIRALGERPGWGYASAEGLTDKGDALHFDTRSQMELGKRYFDVYKTLR